MERPHVILNAAMTLDGKIASRTGDSKISCKEDLERVHHIRNEVDGIMIGINTALIDDPRLTVHKINGRINNPTRIVVDSKGRIPLKSRIFSDEAKTIIAVSKKAEKDRRDGISKRASIVVCGDEKVDLGCLMEELYRRGIKTLLLEGGGTLIWGMLKKHLVDEIRLAISPRIVGGKESITLAEGEGYDLIEEGNALKLRKYYPLGSDLILEYEVMSGKEK